MEITTILISKQTRDILKKLKLNKESYDELLIRITQNGNTNTEQRPEISPISPN